MHIQGFSAGQFLKSRTGLILLGCLAIAAFYLLTAHTTHVVALLPYTILFLCLGLHLFMHKGHGGHAGHAAGHQRAEVNRTDHAAGAQRRHAAEIEHEP